MGQQLLQVKQPLGAMCSHFLVIALVLPCRQAMVSRAGIAWSIMSCSAPQHLAEQLSRIKRIYHLPWFAISVLFFWFLGVKSTFL